jgi:hypothetical protein
MSARETLSLDGSWTFATDPQGIGEREGWFEREGFERVVEVPSPWQLYGADMVGYTGYAWYHRSFELPASFAKRGVAVRFDAVDYESAVWVNGTLVARHEGGYTPFEALLGPDLLEAGVNHLVLRAYDPKDNSEIPHGKQGSWYTRVSGPWQPVSLIARDFIFITALHVTPKPQQEAASVRVLADAPDGTPVTVTVTGPTGESVNSASTVMAAGVATMELDIASPRLWTPDDPALYTASASLLTDTLSSPFGMRWVDYKAGLIYLNGQPLYIRGALDQAFYPETVYRVPSEAAIETEIRLAKAMGLNLLRKHIKLEDPRYLDACDRLGMLIWEEPACYAKYTPQAKKRFTHEIEAMIRRDFNHPAIIAWSLYNEEWGLEWRLWKDAEKQDHVEALYHHVKALDPTRLICDNSGWAHVKTDLNDCHRYFTAPDLISECEHDLAIYVDTPEVNFVASRQANAAGVPVLVSEFGVWGLPEVSRIEKYYNGRPWWFEAQWAGHVEEFKYPATAYRHFERYGLKEIFGSLDTLAGHCQRRMMRALKPIIELMRARQDLAGYVVTEFTDIEWESNGWLDYFRNPKAGHEQFAWFNGATVVMTRLERHNARSNENLQGSLIVSNHTAHAFTGRIHWHVPGLDSLQGDLEIQVPAFGNARLDTGALDFCVPEVPRAVGATLHLDLFDGERLVAHNQEELTFSPRNVQPPDLIGPVLLWDEARQLAPALSALGVELSDTFGPGVLVVTTSLDAHVRAHLEAGGHALYLAEAGDQGPDKGDLSFRRLPRGESWDRAASVLYTRPDLFGDLPINAVFGWELEHMFPHHVLALGNFMHDFGGRNIELTSNQADLAPQRILAGYFEGWLGKFAATVARVPLGQGEVLVTTLRLLENYESQPIGEAMLHRLMALAARPTLATIQVGR